MTSGSSRCCSRSRDADVLHLYCDRLLGPVLAGDPVYAAELLRSLEVFILHNGQWERAAR